MSLRLDSFHIRIKHPLQTHFILEKTPYVPKSVTSGNIAKGLFDRRDFIYIPKDDEYRCPAGERLPNRMTTVEKNKTMARYWS